LIQKVAAATTIEDSFLIFLDNLVEELDDIYADNDDHDVRDLMADLQKYRSTFATAMASNITAS
jgi:hypothetical protein